MASLEADGPGQCGAMVYRVSGILRDHLKATDQIVAR